MKWGALLAGLLAGIMGSMGLGGGTVLILYFTFFTDTAQLRAQGINLLFFLPIALVGVSIYAWQKKIRWKTVLKIVFFATAGAGAGLWLTQVIGGRITAKLFGAFLVGMGFKEIFAKGVAKQGKK